jgi:hypothetical protein
LALKGLTRDQLADKGDTIKTALTGNADFPTPNPTLTTIGTAATTLRTKIATINSTKAAQATAVTAGDKGFLVLALGPLRLSSATRFSEFGYRLSRS